MVNTPTRDWRKKSHRLQKARDEFRERNQEKAVKIKALEGKATDLEQSRARWKEKCKEIAQDNERLAQELSVKDELIEAERKLRQQEAIAHAEELEGLKKNGNCCSNSPRRKRTKNPSETLFGNFCPNVAPAGSFRWIKPPGISGGTRSMLFLAAEQNALPYHYSGLDPAGRVL